jgi:nucleotide-binding universal stress UspA family protein
MTKSWFGVPDIPVRTEASTRPWQNILLPLDGSDLSTWALVRARHLLEREGVSVTLLRVIECRDDRANDLGYQLDSRHGVARNALAEIRRRFLNRSGAVSAELRFGDPATEILRETAEGSHDLILMSTVGRPGLGRSLIGGVAQRVLRSSSSPLLLFRPRLGADEEMSHPEALGTMRFERLLVALDGSEAAEEILPAAESMARTFGSTVHLFRAVSAASTGLPERREAEDYLTSWERRLATRGIPSEVSVGTGDAAGSAVALIRERGIDSVALTSHARKGLARSVYGSVSEEILREADVSLLTLCSHRDRLLPPSPALEHRHVRIE